MRSRMVIMNNSHYLIEYFLFVCLYHATAYAPLMRCVKSPLPLSESRAIGEVARESTVRWLGIKQVGKQAMKDFCLAVFM